MTKFVLLMLVCSVFQVMIVNQFQPLSQNLILIMSVFILVMTILVSY